MTYRPDWFDDIAKGRGIAQIACDINSTIMGSIERHPDEQDADARAIMWVLENWQPSHSHFDAAVKKLLETAIQLYDTKTDYVDSYQAEDELEKQSLAGVAKLFEHIEWENTLPDQEKHKRRLIRYIQSLPQAAETAATHNVPWVMFGNIERIVYHAEQLLGPNWREDVCKERRDWFDDDEDDDTYRIDTDEGDDE